MKKSAAIMPAKRPRTPSTKIDELPLPYIEIDAHGFVTRANRAALALHRSDSVNLVGMSGWDLMAVGEKDFSSAAFLSHMESGEDPPVISRSIFDRSGTIRTYQFHRSLIRDAEGEPTGMRMAGVDVTETARALEETRHAQQWLESAMASLAEAVILTDTRGVVQSLNPAAEKLSGWRAFDLIGKTIDEFLPTQAFLPGGSAFLDLRAMLERPCKGIAGVLTREGEVVRVKISTSPIVDKEKGSLSGVAAILRKI